ncbi:hypothetical protein E4U21_007795 [Claviceps maximensis]|nr:hypothetical protein E4U21_007795 [Claviceps maximensis]
MLEEEDTFVNRHLSAVCPQADTYLKLHPVICRQTQPTLTAAFEMIFKTSVFGSIKITCQHIGQDRRHGGGVRVPNQAVRAHHRSLAR